VMSAGGPSRQRSRARREQRQARMQVRTARYQTPPPATTDARRACNRWQDDQEAGGYALWVLFLVSSASTAHMQRHNCHKCSGHVKWHSGHVKLGLDWGLAPSSSISSNNPLQKAT
jgi:hypothetical protein